MKNQNQKHTAEGQDSKEEILDSVFGNKGLDLREITSKPLYAIYGAMDQYAEIYASQESLKARQEAIRECQQLVKDHLGSENLTAGIIVRQIEKLKSDSTKPPYEK